MFHHKYSKMWVAKYQYTQLARYLFVYGEIFRFSHTLQEYSMIPIDW